MMSAQLQQQASGAASGSSGDKTPSLGGVIVPAEQPAAPPPEPIEPLASRVKESSSPYVRAQANTLVEWQLFDQAAVDRAKKENKPIFLHIGFLACHYCHNTTQDAFMNQAVASVLNLSFIPIIVDREERPDIESIYWNYLQLVNKSAGWPINVFLTPELEPIFGGSYWPGPSSEVALRVAGGGAPIGFLGVLLKLKQSWEERERQCRVEAKDALVQLRKFMAEGTLGPRGLLEPGAAEGAPPYLSKDLDLDIDLLDEAYTQIKKTFDPVNGGFGVVPKFVTPVKYSFLLQLGSLPSVVQDIVGDKEVESIVQMAFYTLRKLQNSALNDHLAGGFARASHTINWTLPHFEKIVAENGLLLGLYLDAWLYSLRKASNGAAGANVATDGQFADVVYSLANYLTSSPVRLPNGCFASSEAADSLYRKGDRQSREGAHYVWTRREFDAVVSGTTKGVSDNLDARVAAAYWNVMHDGNVGRQDDPFDEFINQNILYVSKEMDEVALQFGITTADVLRITTAARKKLAEHRAKERVRPMTDEKIIVASNGIVIGALARTGGALKHGGIDPTSGSKYVGAARDAARFIKDNLWDVQEQELYRAFIDGRREATRAFAEDYAFLIEGLLELYEATGEVEWLQWADELQKKQIELFYDQPDEPPTATHSSSGGFYRTREGEPFDLVRLKDGMDTTLPATNAVSAANLFRLGSLLGDATYTHLARETIYAFEVEMAQHAFLFPGLLLQLVTARLGGRQLAVYGASALSDPVAMAYFRQPRGGLRGLLHVGATPAKPSELATHEAVSHSSWLASRNLALAGLNSVTDGVYVLNKNTWGRATVDDLTLKVQADA